MPVLGSLVYWPRPQDAVETPRRKRGRVGVVRLEVVRPEVVRLEVVRPEVLRRAVLRPAVDSPVRVASAAAALSRPPVAARARSMVGREVTLRPAVHRFPGEAWRPEEERAVAGALPAEAVWARAAAWIAADREAPEGLSRQVAYSLRAGPPAAAKVALAALPGPVEALLPAGRPAPAARGRVA